LTVADLGDDVSGGLGSDGGAGGGGGSGDALDGLARLNGSDRRRCRLALDGLALSRLA
jgi:hypothetical protein